eukprot:TRINITY_DN14412_c0_g1_i1.p1 TRINITY_DN14412_c0_g1~~TRINITY_DN14412_c0_g1_i1.p1  ORF type:complete len:723 (-),score=194.31 TRINITY_DN14412_c0_g1_i1:347-2515(-)
MSLVAKAINLPALLDYVWHLSLPIELVPDIASWTVTFLLALWIAKHSVLQRPRLFSGFLLVWVAWLGTQYFLKGPEVLEETQKRLVVALDVTYNFSQEFLALVKAWAEFFLPFVGDLSKWSMHVWRSLSTRHKLICAGSVAALYVLLLVLQTFYRHQSVIWKTLFHASFLAAGPALWLATERLTEDWLEWTLMHTITTGPAVISLAVLSWRDDDAKKEDKQAGGRAPGMRSFFGGPQVDSAAKRMRSLPFAFATSWNMALHRLWLCYWACWPIVAVLEVGAQRLPAVIASYHSDVDPDQLQRQLQRGLIVFVIWLQFWRGSKMLQFFAEYTLYRMRVFEVLGRLFGERGVQIMRLLGGKGLEASGLMGGGRSWRLWEWITWISRRLWVLAVAAALAVAVAFSAMWLFYKAVRFATTVLTVLLWVFAAWDTADTLTGYTEEFYSRKLSFWILAMLWEALTLVPAMGMVLRLFTPLAFSMWLVAGEPVLRNILLPLLAIVKRTLQSPFSLVFHIFCPCAHRKAEVEQDDDEDEAEDAAKDAEAEEDADADREDNGVEDDADEGGPPDARPAKSTSWFGWPFRRGGGGQRTAPAEAAEPHAAAAVAAVVAASSSAEAAKASSSSSPAAKASSPPTTGEAAASGQETGSEADGNAPNGSGGTGGAGDPTGATGDGGGGREERSKLQDGSGSQPPTAPQQAPGSGSGGPSLQRKGSDLRNRKNRRKN